MASTFRGVFTPRFLITKRSLANSRVSFAPVSGSRGITTGTNSLPPEYEHNQKAAESSIQTYNDFAPRSINPGPRPDFDNAPLGQNFDTADAMSSSLVGFKDTDVGTILQAKNRPTIKISESESVYSALQKMQENGIGALLVENESGGIAGMFSERDYMNKIAVKGLHSRKTQLKDVMSTKVETVSPQTTAGECMHIMTEKRFRHIPVVDGDGKLQGLVSIGDLVKFVLEGQKESIQQLAEYIKTSK